MLVKEFALRYCEFSDGGIMVIYMLYERESKKKKKKKRKSDWKGGSSLTFF